MIAAERRDCAAGLDEGTMSPSRLMLTRSTALVFAVAAWLAASASGRAGAQPLPSETPPPSSPCLDDDAARKGVQARTFLKRRKLELAPSGGLYASDLLSSSYAYGGSASVYFTEDLGLEASFMVSPVALDVDRSLTGFFGDSRFRAGTGYLGLAGLLWSPIHFKVRTSGGGILHGDIQLAAGGGRLWAASDTAQGFAVHAGTRVELFLTRWLSFRLDVRDVLLIQEAVAETRLTNNIVVLGGLGLWIPVWP
jgi:outer membrane beta-barrel protein